MEYIKSELELILRKKDKPESLWVKIDPENLHECEVLAFRLQDKEILQGYLGVDLCGTVFCESEATMLEECTHYIELKSLGVPEN